MKNRNYPTARDRSSIESFKLCLPFLGLDSTGKVNAKKDNEADIEEAFARDHLELSHQQWRRHQWSNLRNTRTLKDPTYNQSKSIYTDIEVTNKKKALDKKTINSIRIAALAENKAKILFLAKRLHLVISFNLTISLLNELKLPLIADELRKIKDLKEIEESNEKEKRNSGAEPQKKKQSYTSISERVMKGRAENKKNSVAPNLLARKPKPSEPLVKRSMPSEETLFAKKENNNFMNKTEDMFASILRNSVNKKAEVAKPDTSKKRKI